MNKEVYSRTKNSKDLWETPLHFFKILENTLKKEYKDFHFTLDPCADSNNRKCQKFYSKDIDGLKQDWKGEYVFVNPPFSDIESWVKMEEDCNNAALKKRSFKEWDGFIQDLYKNYP